jgi:hypothetical protein
VVQRIQNTHDEPTTMIQKQHRNESQYAMLHTKH